MLNTINKPTGPSRTRRFPGALRNLLTVLLAFAPLAPAADAAPFNPTIVTNTNDSGAGSLRQAVLNANANPGADTITFDPAVFATAQTITLTGTNFAPFTGHTTVTGPAAGVTVQGVYQSEVFTVALGTVVSFSKLTISGLDGIRNDNGTLIVSDCVFSTIGTGIRSTNVATVTRCLFVGGIISIENNTAPTLFVSLTVRDCSFSDYLLAIKNSGTAILSGCTAESALTSTSCIYNQGQGSMTLTNCTLLNKATATADTSGALLYNTGTLTFQNCTLSENDPSSNTGTVTLNNSIFRKNFNTATLTDGGGNLIFPGSADFAADLANWGLDPAGLQDNGGPTKTIKLLGGAAINGGLAANVPLHITTDQRGFPRGVGAVDIGAYEEQFPVQLAATTASAAEGTGAGTTAFTFTVSRPGAMTSAVTLDYAVTGTGTNPANAADFGGTLPSGTVTLGVGVSSANITINVTKDALVENDETFKLTLSNPTANHVIGGTGAEATIVTDDTEGLPTIVTNTNDSGAGSLRQAVLNANSNAGADTITFDPTVFATAQTIELQGSNLAPFTGDTTVTGPAAGVTVMGLGGNQPGLEQAFTVEEGTTAHFTGVTILGGFVAIGNNGTLTVNNCAFVGQSEYGIRNTNIATVTGCSFVGSGFCLSNNSFSGAATLTVRDCSFTNFNLALIVNTGIATLSGCTGEIPYSVLSPISNEGSGDLTLTNCTLVNTATASEDNYGTLFYNTGTLSFQNCTLSENDPSSNPSGTVTLKNTIYRKNFNTVNTDNPLSDGGGNLIFPGSSDLAADLASRGLDPAGLQDNGGPTKTIKLLGGAAINGGLAANVPVDVTTDQRGTGYSRSVGTVDIGAYEQQFSNSAPTDITLTATSIAENNAPGATIGTLTATDADAGDTHTFTLVSGGADNAALTITGNTLHINASADFETKSSYAIRIRATDSGTGNLTFEKNFTINITDVTIPQTITFDPLGGMTFGDEDFNVSAMGGASGQPVTYGISGPATIAGNSVYITGAGDVTVTASQAGSGDYSAATPVARTFTVAKAAQTIAFTLPATAEQTDSVTLSATGGASGEEVTFSVVSGPGSITGDALTFTGDGDVVVRASQAGNTNYLAAADVEDTITVGADDEPAGGNGAGQYIGYLTRGGNPVGQVRFSLTGSGSVTGWFVSETGRRNIRLKVNATTGVGTGALHAYFGGASYTLTRQTNGYTFAISGLTGLALRSVTTLAERNAAAGNYNVVLPAPSGSASGFATMRVLPSGLVNFAGRLPDGTPYTGGSLMMYAKRLPTFLQAPGHAVYGDLTLANLATSDVTGALTWETGSASQPIAAHGARAASWAGRTVELALDGGIITTPVSLRGSLPTAGIFSYFQFVVGTGSQQQVARVNTTGLYRLLWRPTGHTGALTNGYFIVQPKANAIYGVGGTGGAAFGINSAPQN